MSNKVYQRLASTVDAYHTCVAKGNEEWEHKHLDRIQRIVKNHLPSGSGFDVGTELHIDESTADKLVFETSYHHMDEHGGYIHWSAIKVVVTPSLAHGYHLDIEVDPGEEDNETFEDYVADTFSYSLDTKLDVSDKALD